MTDNPWTPGPRHREQAELMKPIVDPACWVAHDLAGTEAWVYRLSEPEIADIFDAVASVEADGLELKALTHEDFPLPVFAPALTEIREELLEGRGFAFIKGLPVSGRSRFQNACAFLGIGSHIGKAISQNGKGHLLGHVKNIGGDINAPTGRGYNSPSELTFHADGCDVLSLCCLQTAKSGGRHRICSARGQRQGRLFFSPRGVEHHQARPGPSRRAQADAGPDRGHWDVPDDVQRTGAGHRLRARRHLVRLQPRDPARALGLPGLARA
jgi:hypothetical protein